MRYEFFVTVWAEPFVRKFLDYSLPSLLSANNIPYLAAQADITFHIYTDRESQSAFQTRIADLEANCRIEWCFFEDISYGGGTLADAVRNSDAAIVKHNVQRVTAQRVMAAAGKAGEAAVLLDSDFIFSDGAFRRMHELRSAGKRGVAAMFMRLCQEQALSKLDDMIGDWKTGWPGLEARKLVAVGMQAMHPIADAYFVDREAFTRYPTQLNWPVGEAGFITHCFFPHPVMVMPGGDAAKYFSTMDYECALRCVEQDEDLYLTRSSDEFLVCKMSPAGYLSDVPKSDPPTIQSMAQFALNNTNLRHRYFMDQPVRFVANDDTDAFDATEGETRRFVEAIYKMVELNLGQFSTDNAKTLVYLKSFLGPIENFMSPQVHARLKDRLPEN